VTHGARRRVDRIGRTVIVRSVDGIAATFVICFERGIRIVAPLRADADTIGAECRGGHGLVKSRRRIV
jgi:hypothetical protein